MSHGQSYYSTVKTIEAAKHKIRKSNTFQLVKRPCKSVSCAIQLNTTMAIFFTALSACRVTTFQINNLTPWKQSETLNSNNELWKPPLCYNYLQQFFCSLATFDANSSCPCQAGLCKTCQRTTQIAKESRTIFNQCQIRHEGQYRS